MQVKNGAKNGNRIHVVPSCFAILGFIALFLLPAETGAELQFVEKTNEAGLSRLSPSFGLSWGDFDQDGWEDLYIKNHNVHAPSLYRNSGSGEFEDITDYAGWNFVDDSHGASWGDFDNDGDMDLIQVFGARGYALGTKSNYFFRNDGNKIFVELAESIGVDDPLGRGRTPVWLDYNNDGRLDLFIGNKWNKWQPESPFTPSVLFSNEGNGVVLDVTNSAGLGDLDLEGAHAADIDGDGLMDLLASRPTGILVYKNNGDSGFSNMTYASGLSAVPTATDLSLGDFDNDGDIDVFVCMGHIDWAQDAYEVDSSNIYYRIINRDEKEKRFVFDVENSSVVQFDFYLSKERMWNGDNIYIGSAKYHPDEVPFLLDSESSENHDEPTRTASGIYVWFDSATNKWHLVYKFDQDKEVGGIVTAAGSMGQVDTVNLDIDSIAFTNRLFRNNGKGVFTDVSASSGLDQYAGDAYSAVSADFDNDGDLDLYVVYSGGIFNEPNGLYVNDGQGRFNLDPDAGAQAMVEGRGESVAFADYNNDGFMDLAVTNGLGTAPFHNGQRVLLENQGNENNWVKIKLVGRKSNRYGIGSILTLDAGPLKMTRQQTGGMHTYSQNSQVIHFGLKDQIMVHRLQIKWPCGIVQQLTNIPVNQLLKIVEPEVDLTLTASVSSILQGGVLELEAKFDNSTNRNLSFLFAANLTTPTGQTYPAWPGFLYGPIQVNLAPNESRTENIFHNVPLGTYSGKYVYNGYIGKGLQNLWDEDRFEFIIVSSRN